MRNILVRADGQIEAFIVEASASAETLEFAFRVPWQRVVREELPHRLVVDIPDNRLPAYKLLLDPTTTRREFRVTEVIGDYARLQTGFAYGYVVDVVFTAAGHMLAVLVLREATAGGGTFAISFPGWTSQWNPRGEYYGLPFVSPEQADATATRVDGAKFGQPTD